MRYDRATWTGDSDLSPRASAALNLGRGMTARVGWGYYRQMQGIDDVAALNDCTTYYSVRAVRAVDRGLGSGRRQGIPAPRRGLLQARVAPAAGVPQLEGRHRRVPGAERGPHQGLPGRQRQPRASRSTSTGRRPSASPLRASYALLDRRRRRRSIENVNSPDPLTYDLYHPNPQDQRARGQRRPHLP